MNTRPVKCKSAVRSMKLEDFADLFGTSPQDFSDKLLALINEMDFRYRTISSEERDQVILNVLKQLESDQLKVSGKHRHKDWESGWSENLNKFIETKYDLDELIPKYLRPNQPIRLNRKYVIPFDAKFELNFYNVFRRWLYSKYFKNASQIYEFGCGTGYNLAIITELFPQKKLYGLDWAKSSVELVNRIAESYSYNNMSGILFDMFNPNEDLELAENSIFLSMNSLEQLGNEHEQLIKFFIKKRPMLCIHSEPLFELYDENNLVDYLAVKYHEKRNYLKNYITRLKQLENENKIEIIKIHRIPFGSLYHEGYSLLVWKPA